MKAENGVQFSPVDPFDWNRLWGNEKYSLQNMLLKQVNMPTELFPGEECFEVYDDRVYSEWREAWPLLKYEAGGGPDAALNRANNEDFLAFASKLFSLINKREITLTGATAIRYTNYSSGYPVYRVTGVIAKDCPRSWGVPFTRETFRAFDGRMRSGLEALGMVDLLDEE